MKTKILSVFLMSVLMLSVMGTFVLADEDDNALTGANAGLSQAEIASAIADDNVETSSGIFGDKVRAVFARNAEKRAEIKTKIAAKKMNKLKEVAKEHPEKAKALAKEYEDELDSAFEDFNEIAVDGDKEEVIKALRQTVVMKYRIETHEAKWSEVHSGILEKKSEQMNEEQLAKLEEVFSATETKIAEKISKIEELQENLISRLLVIAPELTEEQIRAKLTAFEDSLAEKKQIREDKLKQHKKSLEAYKQKIEIKDGKTKFEARDANGKLRIETEIDSDDEVIALN